MEIKQKLIHEKSLSSKNSSESRVLKMLAMQSLKIPSNINDKIIKWTGERNKNCYMLSGRFGLDNDDWEVCHGIINPPIGPYSNTDYDHAWCEKSNVVYESVFNKFFEKKDYYDVYIPMDVKRYKGNSLRRIILKNETWGPWK